MALNTRLIFAGTALVLGLLGTSAAHAEDAAPARRARAEVGNGLYLWMDGSWHSVKLPGVDSAWHNATGGPPVLDLGTMTTHSVRHDGFGLRGGLGMLLPQNWVLFGTNGRIELGGSYVDAKGSTAFSGAVARSTLYLADGTYGTGLACVTCVYTSNLDTNFRAWSVDLRVASDVRLGALTLTPSLKGFAGNSRNQQTLSEAQALAGVVQTNYVLNANTRWTDWGARLGLAASMPVAGWVSVGISGDIGLAVRHISFDGNDVLSGVFVTTTSTSLGLASDVTATVANLEANLLLTPWQNVALRGFIGLNYDSKVPGFAGASFSTAGINGTAVSLKTEAATGYYAGGGVTVKF